MQFQYMFDQNNNDLTPTDGTTSNNGTSVHEFMPNYNIIDGSKTVTTLYGNGSYVTVSHLYTGSAFDGFLSSYTKIIPSGHNYEFVDPNDSKRIMAQSDYSVTTSTNTVYKFRIYQLMEPTSSGNKVQVKMRIVNLSTDMNGKETALPNNFFIIRNYDTNLMVTILYPFGLLI